MVANTAEANAERQGNPDLGFTADIQWADEQQQAVDLTITERRRYRSVPDMLSSIGHERFFGALNIFTGALGFVGGAIEVIAYKDPLLVVTGVCLAAFGTKTFFNGMDSLSDRRLIAISERTKLIETRTSTTYSLPDKPNPTTPPQP